MKVIWNTEKHMDLCENNGAVYLSFPALRKQKGFVHGFSTRLGGVSEGYLSSMNLSFNRGDDPKKVTENFKRIAGAIGFDANDLVMSDQTHTTNVRLVTEEDRGKGFNRSKSFTDVDGLITDTPGLVLSTSYADCVPLYFIDPVHRAIGLSHSGWKGTVKRMGQVTVEKMQEVFGTRPADLIAAIGPSICQDCYEVSEDVIEEVEKGFKQEQFDRLFYKKENGRYQLNLWEANRIIMLEAGIPNERISLPGICTCHNPELLFSHRASKGMRGNLSAFLGIKRS